jgi:ribosomal protein L37AE/L43A
MSTDNKPSRNEDEYFAKRDAELMKAQRAKLDAERQSAARTAHYMKCPKCGADLVEEEHNQVKIDRCKECNGMWLDAGELQMIREHETGKVGGFISDVLKGFHFK